MHHIDGDPSNNAPENLAVMCTLPCHEKTKIKGGSGRELTPDQVRIYKQEWESGLFLSCQHQNGKRSKQVFHAAFANSG